MGIPTRKIVYVLGAGFSYGTGHKVPWGKSYLEMPLQANLLEKLFQYKYRSISTLDDLARIIRIYFAPSRHRPRRKQGAYRHDDLMHLSVEQIVTFFEEMARDEKDEKLKEEFKNAESTLRTLTLELITYLSSGGKPSQNKILKSFRNLVLDTDTVITFNWDTVLDRVLSKGRKKWHPAWGYGKAVHKIFEYSGHVIPSTARKHCTLLKLHGSINWLACGDKRTIQADYSPRNKFDDVVMMPPKMLKHEIWGGEPTEPSTDPPKGNWAVHKESFYPHLWKDAESALSKAKRVVFIGYSFPAADTSVYGLIRRSLALAKTKYHEYPEIEIVDPNALSLATVFRRAFMIEIPLKNQFLSLDSYVSERERP